MAKVHVVNVSVLENPSTFLSKFQFEITFECVEDLQEGKYVFVLLFINPYEYLFHNSRYTFYYCKFITWINKSYFHIWYNFKLLFLLWISLLFQDL